MDVKALLALIALVISVISLLKSRKQELTMQKIEINGYLHEAWDFMGGQKGSDTIMSFSSKNDLILARREIEKALTINPKHVKANYYQGVLFEAMKQNKDAEQSYLKSIKFSKGKEYSAFHNLGRIYLKEKKPTYALKLFCDALKSCEKKDEILYNIGVTYLDMGEQDLAIENFKASIKENEKYSRPYSNLIAIYGIRGEYENAERLITSAIEHKIVDEAIHYNTLAIYRALGNNEKIDRINEIYQSLTELNK